MDFKRIVATTTTYLKMDRADRARNFPHLLARNIWWPCPCQGIKTFIHCNRHSGGHIWYGLQRWIHSPEDDLLFISMASCWKQQIILSQHVQIWKVRYVSTGIHHWQTSGWCRNSTCHLQWYNRLKVFSVKLVWSILTFQFIYIRPSPTAPLSHLLSVKIEKERQNPPSNSSSIRTASVSRFANCCLRPPKMEDRSRPPNSSPALSQWVALHANE